MKLSESLVSFAARKCRFRCTFLPVLSKANSKTNTIQPKCLQQRFNSTFFHSTPTRSERRPFIGRHHRDRPRAFLPPFDFEEGALHSPLPDLLPRPYCSAVAVTHSHARCRHPHRPSPSFGDATSTLTSTTAAPFSSPVARWPLVQQHRLPPHRPAPGSWLRF